MLKTVGRLDQGIAAYRKAIALKPTLGEAWWSLANLKTVRFEEADIQALQAALQDPQLKDDDRFHLEFAPASVARCRAKRRSVSHYESGNALRRRYHPFRSGDLTSLVDRSIVLFTADLRRGPEGTTRRTRSSSSACRVPVQPWSSRSCPRTAGRGYRRARGHAGAGEGAGPLSRVRDGHERCRSIGGRREYLERTAVQRRTERPLFIDKLPNNWMFVPFIHWVLPNAKIIDVRRHPLSCCFSNFRQHFARGQDFTYDLEDLGHYYSDYVRLLAHVDAALPGRVHRVIYEQLVDDTETEVRALLTYCGLEFEESCLEFYNTDRAVRTPSAQQVRQPIYRESIEEWRAYERHLEPPSARSARFWSLSRPARVLRATGSHNRSQTFHPRNERR